MAMLVVPALASAVTGDLFESDNNPGVINQFTPGGVKSTVVSGLSAPKGLAFDVLGNFYEANIVTDRINRHNAPGVRIILVLALPL